MVHYKSAIPNSAEAVALDQPFEYSVDGVDFYIPPLSLHDFLEVEKKMHESIKTLIYSTGDLTQAIKDKLNILSEKEHAIQRMEYLIDILFELSEPVDPSDSLIDQLIHKHNAAYWYKPSKKIASFKEWFATHITLNETICASSFLLSYCSEIKKKLYLILQTGITKYTPSPNKQNPISFESTVEDWKQGYQSLGSEMLDMPLP